MHGKGSFKYENVRLGLNARLDTLQAAILLPKLHEFDKETEHRNWAANRYAEKLKNIVQVPVIKDGFFSSFGYYTVKAKNEEHRTKLMDGLKAAGVPTMIYYPMPLHLQKVYTSLGYREGDFPVSEKLCGCVFSLPMHGYITEDVIDYICDTIQNI